MTKKYIQLNVCHKEKEYKKKFGQSTTKQNRWEKLTLHRHDNKFY